MIKKFKTNIAVLFTLAFMIAGNALAQEKLTFGDFDKDNNLVIERDEFIATYTKHYLDNWMGHGSIADKDLYQEHMEKKDTDRKDRFDFYLTENDFNMAVYRVWDGDADERLSKEEFRDEFGYEFAGFVGDAFEQVDTDNDGFVAFVEYENKAKETGKFYDWDIDGDLKLNPAELAIGTFNTWDIDSSGFLDRNEYNRFDRYYLEF